MQLTNGQIRHIADVFGDAHAEAIRRGSADDAYDISGEFSRVFRFIRMTQRKLSLANTNFPPESLNGHVTDSPYGANVELIAPDTMDHNRYIVRTPSGKYASYLKNCIKVPELLLEEMEAFQYGDD